MDRLRIALNAEALGSCNREKRVERGRSGSSEWSAAVELALEVSGVHRCLFNDLSSNRTCSVGRLVSVTAEWSR